jgi:hypothetical protein
MKNKQEIKKMAARCLELRKYIANFSYFDDNNWENLDTQANTLTACLDLTESKVSTLLDNRQDIVGEKWLYDPECKTYDWILENTYDDLVSKDDIKVFKKGK